jgi:hypothetical protein
MILTQVIGTVPVDSRRVRISEFHFGGDHALGAVDDAAVRLVYRFGAQRRRRGVEPGLRYECSGPTPTPPAPGCTGVVDT